MKRFSILATVAAMALATSACSGSGGGQEAVGGDVGSGADWVYHGGGVDESGFSRLDTIDTANVDKLGLAWSLDLPGEVTLQARL